MNSDRVRHILTIIVLCSAAASLPVEANPDADKAQTIDNYIQDLSEQDLFSGAVLVAKDGRPLVTRAVGDADKETARKNTADTPINMGSANKMFTAIAIAQLVEKGLIDWQDTVGEFLPDYPNQTVRDVVTIEHLLSHSSGTVAFSDPDDFDGYRKATSVSEMIDIISDNPLDFEPGTSYAYSNAGPWILGRIIEVVSGDDYYDYIQANILDKAGMTNTGFFYKNDAEAGLARGYMKPNQGRARPGQELVAVEGEWKPNTAMIALRGSPSGSAYSSVNDMLKFANAMNANALISQSSFEILTTPRHGRNENQQYGYLFGVRKTNNFTSWGHNGGGPGIQADFVHYPELGYTIIVLSNYGGSAFPVSERIQEILTTSSNG